MLAVPPSAPARVPRRGLRHRPILCRLLPPGQQHPPVWLCDGEPAQVGTPGRAGILPTHPVPQFPQADRRHRPSRYIVGTLERMVADRYVLVCLSGAAARGQIPSFSWMKRCYRAMDRW